MRRTVWEFSMAPVCKSLGNNVVSLVILPKQLHRQAFD